MEYKKKFFEWLSLEVEAWKNGGDKNFEFQFKISVPVISKQELDLFCQQRDLRLIEDSIGNYTITGTNE